MHAAYAYEFILYQLIHLNRYRAHGIERALYMCTRTRNTNGFFLLENKKPEGADNYVMCVISMCVVFCLPVDTD